MKLSRLLSATLLVTATNLSFAALATDGQTADMPVQDAQDQASSLAAIKDFEADQALPIEEQAFQRCKATVYTRYTSIKLDSKKTITRFNYDGGNCRRFNFSIIRNYEGHDLTVTLRDANGNRVAGGYSSSASKSLYQAGTYYWEVENETKTSPNRYGGFTYEVRSKG